MKVGDYAFDYKDLLEDDEVEAVAAQERGITADGVVVMAQRAMSNAGGSSLTADATRWVRPGRR